MKVQIKANNHGHREKLALALVGLGYKVQVKQIENHKGYARENTKTDYYIEIEGAEGEIVVTGDYLQMSAEQRVKVRRALDIHVPVEGE